ncbi:DUF2254 domain-containing protein [Ammonicoccus fulvus]|uniref:DUF2254 domain-containing protein n=1 Tax=Ammonicoccus fulvus TaxID=3138240 RepID=A0ABZ3FTA0_9ACTN
MEGFLTRLRALPTRIWFAPAVLIAVGLVLGEALVALDSSRLPEQLPAWLTGLLFASGPTGASAMVTTVGTAVFGVAGTAFSITISVIATASSTYGPRLVRNFMADRGNQIVLGMFGATFTYCLMVLRRIRTGDDDIGVEAFVPQLAVNFTLLLAVVDVALLIYFIHHIATSIEVSTLTGATRRDLARAIDRLYPREHPELSTSKTHVPLNQRFEVRATESGFIAQLYPASLRSAAMDCSSPVVVLVRPGDHILTGTPLAVFDPVAAEDPDGLARRVRDAFEIGPARTPEQDIRFCLSRLIEIGVRAMSPGTNDPYTAVNAVHELTTALCDLITRPEPRPGRLPDSSATAPVLVLPQVSRAELVRQAFDELRPWVASAPSVVSAMTDLGDAVRRCGDDAIVAEVDRQLDALTESVGSADLATLDRERLLERLAEVRAS